MKARLLVGLITTAGLVALVVAVYLVIVIWLGRPPTDDEQTLLALSVAAAVISALLWVPLRARVQRLGQRLVGPRRASPEELVRTFGSRSTRELPLDEILLQLAESLRESLALEVAEVWTGSDGLFERTVSDPDLGPARLELTSDEESVVVRAGVSGAAWAATWLPAFVSGREDALLRIAPAAHAGALLGLLVAERARGGEAFTLSEEQTLAELARQAGVLLNTARLDSALQATLEEVRRQADELRASRARVVAAADAERRRIERDLHDGAQASLVALALKLGLARELAASDSDAAQSMLAELGEDLERTIEEVRDLAQGIYPPLLAERGLKAALSTAASRLSVPVRVEAETIGRYPAEIEAAVYFCCLEALQNAAKHGGEGIRASLRVREEEGAVAFEVEDDGTGFDPRALGRGSGLTNMADRLGAIGGRLRVESAPGAGTRVAGTIPIPKGEQPRLAAEPERVLATVLFTDIVRSTERAAELGDRRWGELLEAHHALVRHELEAFGGREVNTTGDGFLATFEQPAQAVRCAGAIASSMNGLGLEVRAGLHTGECELLGGDVGGIAVHIGARVASVAGAGEVLVSSTVRDLVAGSGIEFEDRGIAELKGIPGEWHLYRLVDSSAR
jgi:signal transduction histidine kinase